MMTDRLRKLRVVDPVLTQLAIGHSNASFVSEALFPIVKVEKEGIIVPKFGKESFQAWNTERALGADSNRMDRRDVGGIDVVLVEHDLSYPVDYRESQESMFDEEAAGIKLAKDGVDLRRELTCAALAQKPATYASGAKKALSGAAKWSNGGGNPQEEVETGKEVIRSRIGIRPNTVVMGPSVYRLLKYHPKLQEALGSNERKVIRIEHLKDLFEVENVVIGEAVSGMKEQSDIWGDNLVLAYVAKGEQGNKERPSYGYTFQKGKPVADTFDSEDGKVKFLRYTHIYKPVVVGADAGYLISDIE
ncbi:major capsid protein [Oligella urethralis]|nr:major capsid protein [Oligella urethralis]